MKPDSAQQILETRVCMKAVKYGICLERDHRTGTLFVSLIAVVVLAAWACWLLLSIVPLYEFTESARLEVRQRDPSRRVVATHLAIGRQVKAGDILVELALSYVMSRAKTLLVIAHP